MKRVLLKAMKSVKIRDLLESNPGNQGTIINTAMRTKRKSEHRLEKTTSPQPRIISEQFSNKKHRLSVKK